MSASSSGRRLTLREKLDLTRPSNPEFKRLAGLTDEEAQWAIKTLEDTVRYFSIKMDIDDGMILTKEQADFYLNHEKYLDEVVTPMNYPPDSPAWGYFAKRDKFFENHPELKIS